jgi:hypothetical protein
VTVNTQLPASSAGEPTVKNFGSASVRLLPPQLLFESVYAQAAGLPRDVGVEVRWPTIPPTAANRNERQSSAA